MAGGTLQSDAITNSAGTGAPTFTYGLIAGTSQDIQADNFSNSAGTGSPTFAQGANIVGAISANDSAVVFTATSNRTQVCTPTAARTYTMPTTNILAGDTWYFYNKSSTAANFITLQSSGSNTIDYVMPLGFTKIIALQSTPTAASHWLCVEATSQWVSFTPTWAALGTVTFNGGLFKRQGDSMLMNAGCLMGAPTGSAITLLVPNSFILDTTKIPSTTALLCSFGTYSVKSTSVTALYPTYSGRVFYASSTSLLGFAYTAGATAGGYTSAVGNTYPTNSDIDTQILIPIVGWAG